MATSDQHAESSGSEEEEVKSYPVAKYFASSDKAVRDKAVTNLERVLVARGDVIISDAEMTKLWKGLFFCYYHSDKPLVQQALASDLSELILKIPNAPAALHFLKGFWTMIGREWNKIDHHRIDKYYLLVRRFVNAAFRLQLREDWNEECCEAYEYIMAGPGGPLNPDPKTIGSLAYHLGDIYLEELEKVLTDSETTETPTLDLIHPFITFTAQTPSKVAYDRLSEAMFDPFLSALTPRHDEPQRKRARLIEKPTYTNIIAKTSFKHVRHCPKDGQEGLRKAFLKMVFEAAAHPEVREANRRKLYAFWKAGVAEGQGDSSEWDAS